MRPEEPSRISVLGLVSMGLPFVSLLLFALGVSFREWTRVAFYLPTVALVLGIAALIGIKRSGGRLRGRGFAIVGIVLGLGGTLAIAVTALALRDMMCGYEGTC